MKKIAKFSGFMLLIGHLLTHFACKQEPIPSFTINYHGQMVAGESVTFSENSVDGLTTEWQFKGTNIQSASGKQTTVIYNIPGKYDVTVTVKNRQESSTQTIVVTIHPASWRFLFPGGGQKNNNNPKSNGSCCIGETATVNNFDLKPLGYIYYWQDTTRKLDNRIIASDFQLPISGTGDINARTNRTESSFFFPIEECVVGQSQKIRVGRLEYTVKILAIAYPADPQYAKTHFYRDSLKFEVNVNWVIQ